MAALTIDNSSLFEQFPLPLIWLNRDNEMARLNAAAEALLKLCEGDASPAKEVWPPSRLNWLDQEMSKFSNMTVLEHTFEKEFHFQAEVRCFKVLVKQMDAFDGPGTLVSLVDITSQKGSEKLVRQIRRDLESQVEQRTAELNWANDSLRKYIDECKRSAVTLSKLSSAVEQTADHVIITDKNGVIEYVNPAFERLTGFSLAEVVGKTPRIVKSGEHSRNFFDELWKTLLAGQVFRADFINKKKNGELYCEEKTITPIKDEQGRITHFVSVGRTVAQCIPSN